MKGQSPFDFLNKILKMKLYLLTGFLFLHSMFSYSQAYGQSKCSSVYEKSFSYNPGFSEDHKILVGKCVIVNADQTIVLTGEVLKADGRLHGFVSKFDTSGNSIWNKSYDSSLYNQQFYLTRIVKTNDNGYLVGGVIYNTQLCLIKLNGEGVLQWVKTYKNDRGYSFGVRDMVVTADGGFAIGGYYKPELKKTMALVMKTDDLGNLIWNNVYESLFDSDCFSLLEDGNSIIACGYHGEIFSQTNGFLMKLKESNGQLIWIKDYRINSVNNNFTQLFNYKKGNKKGYIINSSNGSDQTILTTDKNGLPLSALNIELPGLVAGLIYPTPDNGFILCNNTIYLVGIFDHYNSLIKINQNGDVLWNKKINYGSPAIKFESISPLKNGGYVLTGNKQEGYDYPFEMELLQTDNLGFGGTNCIYVTSDIIVSTPGYTVNSNFHWLSIPNKSLKVNADIPHSDYDNLFDERMICSTCKLGPVATIVGNNNLIREETYPGLKISPNPVKNELTISFNSKEINHYNLIISDLNGKTLITSSGITVIGENRFNTNINNFYKGMYMIRITSGNNKVIVGKFMKE